MYSRKDLVATSEIDSDNFLRELDLKINTVGSQAAPNPESVYFLSASEDRDIGKAEITDNPLQIQRVETGLRPGRNRVGRRVEERVERFRGQRWHFVRMVEEKKTRSKEKKDRVAARLSTYNRFDSTYWPILQPTTRL